MARRKEQLETLIYLRNIMTELSVLTRKVDDLIVTFKQHETAIQQLHVQIQSMQETLCIPSTVPASEQ